MSIRLVVTFAAAPGKGAELAKFYTTRAAECRQEPGCEQFDCFQSVNDPDKVILLERWKDKAALEAHARHNATRPGPTEGLRLGTGEREDYEYNRTR